MVFLRKISISLPKKFFLLAITLFFLLGILLLLTPFENFSRCLMTGEQKNKPNSQLALIPTPTQAIIPPDFSKVNSLLQKFLLSNCPPQYSIIKKIPFGINELLLANEIVFYDRLDKKDGLRIVCGGIWTEGNGYLLIGKGYHDYQIIIYDQYSQGDDVHPPGEFGLEGKIFNTDGLELAAWLDYGELGAGIDSPILIRGQRSFKLDNGETVYLITKPKILIPAADERLKKILLRYTHPGEPLTDQPRVDYQLAMVEIKGTILSSLTNLPPVGKANIDLTRRILEGIDFKKTSEW